MSFNSTTPTNNINNSSYPSLGHLIDNNNKIDNNSNQWRFSYPLDISTNNIINNINNNNNKNNKINNWKNGIISNNGYQSKSCPNLLNSYSKRHTNIEDSNITSNNIDFKELNEMLEPRPVRSTKLEEMVKGRIKERLGKLLNNEMMQKQGKAIGKGASIYENNISKSKERARNILSLQHQSQPNLSSIIIVN
ncbi:hypothetical protein RB653_000745 [Dictyostelium firmibasis]|uniref:Uncharacterized protein n=1 Tax=Dictyostelium firmibasis TaxID=79012 RepID=A0AAN7U3T8_9MYCE